MFKTRCDKIKRLEHWNTSKIKKKQRTYLTFKKLKILISDKIVCTQNENRIDDWVCVNGLLQNLIKNIFLWFISIIKCFFCNAILKIYYFIFIELH